MKIDISACKYEFKVEKKTFKNIGISLDILNKHHVNNEHFNIFIHVGLGFTIFTDCFKVEMFETAIIFFKLN